MYKTPPPLNPLDTHRRYFRAPRRSRSDWLLLGLGLSWVVLSLPLWPQTTGQGVWLALGTVYVAILAASTAEVLPKAQVHLAAALRVLSDVGWAALLVMIVAQHWR